MLPNVLETEKYETINFTQFSMLSNRAKAPFHKLTFEVLNFLHAETLKRRSLIDNI